MDTEPVEPPEDDEIERIAKVTFRMVNEAATRWLVARGLHFEGESWQSDQARAHQRKRPVYSEYRFDRHIDEMQGGNE